MSKNLSGLVDQISLNISDVKEWFCFADIIYHDLCLNLARQQANSIQTRDIYTMAIFKNISLGVFSIFHAIMVMMTDMIHRDSEGLTWLEVSPEGKLLQNKSKQLKGMMVMMMIMMMMIMMINNIRLVQC